MRDSVPGPPAHCPDPAASRMLLILGPPAGGKTALAERLAARYELLRLQKDEIKEVLFDTLGLDGAAAWSRALSDASFALLFALAPRLLRPDRVLLLEGNFRPDEHEPAIRKLLQESGTRLVQVLCRARTETLIARLQARAADPRRHRGHRDFDSLARLRHSEPETRFLSLPGPRLLFDSEAPPERELATLCTALDPWIGSAKRSSPRR